MSARPLHGPHPVDVHFEPYNPEDVNRYPEVINGIRRRCPVAWSDGAWSVNNDTGFWLLTADADVRASLMKWQIFSSGVHGAAPVAWDQTVFRNGFQETDPPLHTYMRKAVSDFFQPRALEAHEDGIRNIIGELLEDCLGKSPVDFVVHYASRLPSRVFFEFFLREDPKEIGWIIDLIQQMFEKPTSSLELGPKLLQWCAKVIESRRRAGRTDDLAGAIAQAGQQGDFELEERQRVETLFLLILAGMETTANAVSAIIHTLATRPELRFAMAGADAATINKAVDEFLRFASPVPALGRTLAQNTEVRGCPMAKGERVLVSLMGANHDPEVYSNPDSLDLTRANASQHVAFGNGYHKCLGMHLARREMRLTIEALSKLAVFELVPAANVGYRVGPARGFTSLPIVCAR
jgi:cytochrome P450